MTRPAITDMTVDELRGAARVLRDLAAATVGFDAFSIRQLMEREAQIAEWIIDNTEADEEEEKALDGLADAVADHLAQAGDHRNPPASTRVAPSAPAPESGRPFRGRWSEEQRALQRQRMRQRMAGEAIWTEARLALMHAEFPTANLHDLLARVNALPGLQVASVDAMRQRAKADGVARDPAWLREQRREAMQRAIEAKHQRAQDADARRYTQIEQDALRERFRDHTTALRLTQAQAAEAAGIAPGSITPWLSGKSASGIAQKVEAWLDSQDAPVPPDHFADARKMVPTSPPLVQAPGEDGDPRLDAGDEQEARDMLAKGKGARDLTHWFGGALTWWQAWCERERAAMGRAA